MRRKSIPSEMIGQRFGRWTVLRVSLQHPNHRPRSFLDCRCDCGIERSIAPYSLLNGDSKSCSCLKRDLNLRHGHCISKPSAEYRTWQAMMSRCYNAAQKRFNRYGGRGIVVCEQWHQFPAFLADMGLKPTPKHSIERRNLNGNYESDNCYWATNDEQSRNTSRNIMVTFDGITLCAEDWAKRLGLTPTALAYRLRKWNIDEAMTLPVGQGPWLHRKRKTQL